MSAMPRAARHRRSEAGHLTVRPDGTPGAAMDRPRDEHINRQAWSNLGLRIRAMSRLDLPQVLENEGHCYAYPWPLWFFRLTLRSGLSAWVIESQRQVVGHGVMSFKKDWAHIMNVCVAAPYQGRGLGRRMFAHLIATARAHGMTRAWLEVRPENERAIRLYRSFGFKAAGVRKGYYREAAGRQDALIMIAHL